jgi:hypothetical protein
MDYSATEEFTKETILHAEAAIVRTQDQLSLEEEHELSALVREPKGYSEFLEKIGATRMPIDSSGDDVQGQMKCRVASLVYHTLKLTDEDIYAIDKNQGSPLEYVVHYLCVGLDYRQRVDAMVMFMQNVTPHHVFLYGICHSILFESSRKLFLARVLANFFHVCIKSQNAELLAYFTQAWIHYILEDFEKQDYESIARVFASARRDMNKYSEEIENEIRARCFRKKQTMTSEESKPDDAIFKSAEVLTIESFFNKVLLDSENWWLAAKEGVNYQGRHQYLDIMTKVPFDRKDILQRMNASQQPGNSIYAEEAFSGCAGFVFGW